jgi:hypothetical protein
MFCSIARSYWPDVGIEMRAVRLAPELRIVAIFSCTNYRAVQNPRQTLEEEEATPGWSAHLTC